MTGDGGAGQTSGNGGGGGQEENNKKKKPIGYWRKVKMVVLSRIKRAKKRLKKKKKKTKRKGDLDSGNCCCCLYIRGMPKLDSSSSLSSSESPTSDPNCSEFGSDSLRGLIEKSDFLLKECNTHLDVYSPPNDYDDDDLHDD